jgi:lipopolysaccharide/colanic/teichoic acid biosynthesis glycosyltransferase
MLVIAIAVRLDSPGPAIFAGERVGQHNRRFKMYKFRSMYLDAEQRARDVAVRTEQGLVHKRRDDPRITRVGRFLRKTSLDELPQLFNILKGDMSLVGPRPCLRYETDLFEPHHFVRFSVPAGVTGLWQVTARARTTFKEALDLDVTYVRSWSLGLDLRLICRTPLKILKGDSTT